MQTTFDLINSVNLYAFIAQIGSYLDSPLLFVGILIPAFLFGHEKRYGFGLFFILFTMIDNYYLKSLFQTPLPPPLEGWAFPSGHMHCALIFWGWLACEYRRPIFTALVGLILSIVAYGLVFHGYHYPVDILGAIGFGSLFLLSFHLLSQYPLFRKTPSFLGLLLSGLGFILIMLLPPESRKPHLWQALGALLGFTLGWASQTTIDTYSVKQKILQLALTLSGCAVLYMSFTPSASTNLKIFAQFFMIACWINLSKIVFQKIWSEPSKRSVLAPS